MNGNVSIPSATIKSPCVRVCRMDDADERCLGCNRTPQEIREWFKMSDEQKLAIIAAIPDRMRERIARRRAERDNEVPA